MKCRQGKGIANLSLTETRHEGGAGVVYRRQSPKVTAGIGDRCMMVGEHHVGKKASKEKLTKLNLVSFSDYCQ